MKCSYVGCEKDSRGKSGLCKTHYKTEWERTKMSPESRARRRANRRARQKKRYASDPEYREGVRLRVKTKYATDAEYRTKVLSRERKRTTGCCPETAELLRVVQNGLCAVCPCVLTPEKKRGVVGEYADHCHASGQLRGLLCRTCNLALGGYERYQRSNGYVLAPFESYLNDPPARRVGRKI